MKTVTQTQWMQLLGSTRTEIEVPVRGFSHVAPDWGWTGRDLPRHIIWLLTGGECCGTVCGTRVSLKAGDFFWFSPHAVHDFRVLPDRERARIHHINLIVRTGTHELRLKDDFVKLEGMWDLAADMAAIVDELTAPRPWHDLRVRAMLQLLFSVVFARQRDSRAGTHSLDRRQRQHLMAYVDRMITGRPDAADLAAELDLSPDYFSRLFRRTYGSAPRTWLVEERIRRIAAALLEHPRLPAGRVAKRFGYEDMALFSRQFSKAMGVGPRAWRQRMS